ncbi:MAG: SRPBCC family protein [Patescibacteria group bacterium]
MKPDNITIETVIEASIQKVWECYTRTEHVINWNFADPSWECPSAQNDLKVGGKFSYRMQAKDGSTGFDFEGEYIDVRDLNCIKYVMEDGRKVEIYFEKLDENTTHLTIDFDIEQINPAEMQRGGWQSILDNFKKYVEKL